MNFLPALLLLCQLSGGKGPRPVPMAPPKSVLVILLDDVAQQDIDELSLAGWAPNLDALAAGGMTFCPTPGMRGGYASPLCKPGRECIQTGRWVFRNDGLACQGMSPSIDPSTVTLGDVGRAAMASTAFFGKWHLGGTGAWWTFPAQLGYQRARIVGGNLNHCGNDYYSWQYATESSAPVTVTTYAEQVFEDELLEFWDSNHGPKLAFFSASLAHQPFQMPPAAFIPVGYPALPQNPTSEEWLHLYMAAVDVEIGRILTHLDPAHDLVFVVGDNGTDTATEPAKNTIAERGIRVPFIVWGGGLPPSVQNRMAALVDVLPTAAAYLGVAPPAGIDGISLFSPDTRPYIVAGIDAANHSRYCSRTSTWKLVWEGSLVNRVETVYDMVNDPTELTPLPTSVLTQLEYDALAGAMTSAGIL